jgi:hypothetical protein
MKVPYRTGNLVPSLFGLALAAGLAGCAVEPPPVAPVTPDGTVEDQDTTPLRPEDTTRGRDRRRMDLDQLTASIARVTGGLSWKNRAGGDRFAELAPTLGKPDYVNNTQEDLNASLLFAKFLDDAASDVCTQLVDREYGGGERTLRVTAEPGDLLDGEGADRVRADLRQALLRFHGRTLTADSTELDAWIWLFRTSSEVASEGQGPDQPGVDANPETRARTAWRTTCVALLTHPDFYTW